MDAIQTEARRQMEAAAAMPLTVQRAGATLQALEEGDVKLRVRVMESERADRRQNVMQVRVPEQRLGRHCCNACGPESSEGSDDTQVVKASHIMSET